MYVLAIKLVSLCFVYECSGANVSEYNMHLSYFFTGSIPRVVRNKTFRKRKKRNPSKSNASQAKWPSRPHQQGVSGLVKKKKKLKSKRKKKTKRSANWKRRERKKSGKRNCKERQKN